jgi:SAM-dependent methyltransferase
MPMTHVRPCPACTSPESRPAGEADGFEMRRCRSCRTLFTARLPAPAESLDYDDYYHEGNLEVPAFVHSRLDELVGSFEAERRLGAWLDVGCGAGTLLEAVRGRGWEAVGTEVSRGAAEAVAARGFDIRVGELPELGLPDGGFDVVSMVEVVEHVPDPRALLAQALPLVRPGGVLYVTTPHGCGISARLLRSGWSVVAPPEHLQLFSVPGLRRALGAAGFTVADVRTQAVNPAELLAAVRRSRPQLDASSRVDSGYRLNEALSGSARGAFVKRLANGALSLTRLGDSIRLVGRRPA